MKRYFALIPLLISLALVLGYSKPEPIVVEKIVTVEKEVIVEKPVEKIVVVEKIVSISVPIVNHIIETEEIVKPLKQWESLEDFQLWLDNSKLPVMLISDSNGVVSLINPIVTAANDCDDYALDLVKKANEDGFMLWVAPTYQGYIFGVPVTDIIENHVGVWTEIQGVYYFADPSPVPNQNKAVKVVNAD